MPESATIHDVFHVSQLKKFYGELPVTSTLPSYMVTPTQAKVPAAVLERKVYKVGNRMVIQLLVQWEGYPSTEATWEEAETFQRQFPDFQLL